MKTIWHLAWLAAILSTMARGSGGNEVGGSGDAVSGWFVATATMVVGKIEEGKRGNAPWARDIDAVKLRAALKTEIILVDDKNRKALETRFGRFGESDVKLEAQKPFILIERETWTNFWVHNAPDLRGLLHVYLEASGQKDGHFRLSARVPFLTATGAANNGSSLKTVWTLPGGFTWPLAHGDGFVVVHSMARSGDHAYGDAVEAYTADGERRWKFQPHFDRPTPREEKVGLSILGLAAANPGFFVLGEMRSGLCQHPFVVKVSDDGRQEWIRHIKSRDPWNDCWERLYETPVAIAAESPDRAIVLFDRRIARTGPGLADDPTERLADFAESDRKPSHFRFRDIVPLGNDGWLLLGALELNDKVVPFVKQMDRTFREVWSTKLADRPGSYFALGGRLTDDRYLFVAPTSDAQEIHAFDPRGHQLTRLTPFRWKGAGDSDRRFIRDYAYAVGGDGRGNAVIAGNVSRYSTDQLFSTVSLRFNTFHYEGMTRDHETFRAGGLALVGPDGAVRAEVSLPGMAVHAFLRLADDKWLLVQSLGMKLVRSPF